MKSIVVACAIAASAGCKKDKKPSEASPPPPPSVVDAAAPAVDAPPIAGPPETRLERIEVGFISSKIPVDAQVPVGWIRRDGIAAWDPPDADQLPTWHRSFSIEATCDGGCTPAELDKQLPRYLDAIVARHKQPNMSGNADQDAKAIAPVTELERGELPQGGRYLLLRVEKPPAFANDPYPDMFAGTCVARRPTDGFMIVTSIRAAPDDENSWWPVLVAACKATTPQ